TLSAVLPEGMRTHLRMSYEPPYGHDLVFHTADWRIISQANRCGTVRRIATALRTPELDVARMIAPLIEQGLLNPIGASSAPGRLPEEAERLSMGHFDLFTLLISMEQDWLKRRTQTEQLVALATYINQTMRTLEETCRASGLVLAETTLQSLLEREGIHGVEGYEFHIAKNRLDVDNFTTYCRQILDPSGRRGRQIPDSQGFYERSFDTLERALAAAFQAINARVASPLERGQNQEAWEVLFMTFSGQPTGAM
ncbi:MAG TPA: hypothetical protein VKQ36_06330, partial [Ktedonobacterales bacterium]|nr:hypothetical protein [Ktedonobacterales bacterium]